MVAPGSRPSSHLAMCASDRKRFIVVQVNRMSFHHLPAGTRQWNKKLVSFGAPAAHLNGDSLAAIGA